LIEKNFLKKLPEKLLGKSLPEKKSFSKKKPLRKTSSQKKKLLSKRNNNVPEKNFLVKKLFVKP